MIPDWLIEYQLPHEGAVISNINSLRDRILQLNNDLRQQEEDLSVLTKYKSLLVSSGSQLERIAQTVFEELGFEIIEAEENRDDLIVKYTERVAVIEIKGINGSAAEKHAAQLEKWVVSYYAEKESKPKGILLVNAFKDMPLKDRPLDAFPHQMLKFSEQREHCLISSLQLLGLFFEIKNRPERKEELINGLFGHVGIYPYFTDWQLFISKQSE